MNDEPDQMGWETPDETVDHLRRELKREGARVAYEALVAVCRDPKATPSARATAGNALLRAAGLFDKRDDDENLEPHQMTAAQLERAISKVKRQLQQEAAPARRRRQAGAAEEDGVFG